MLGHRPVAGASAAAVLRVPPARRGSYNAAVRNMSDFRGFAVQALLNTGRPALGESLGYRLPATAAQERVMWRTWSGYVRGDQRCLPEPR